MIVAAAIPPKEVTISLFQSLKGFGDDCRLKFENIAEAIAELFQSLKGFGDDCR